MPVGKTYFPSSVRRFLFLCRDSDTFSTRCMGHAFSVHPRWTSLPPSEKCTPIECVCVAYNYRSCSMIWILSSTPPVLRQQCFRSSSLVIAFLATSPKGWRSLTPPALLSWPPQKRCEVPHVPLKDGHRHLREWPRFRMG